MDGGSEVTKLLNDILVNPWMFLKEYIEYFEKMKNRLLKNISNVLDEEGVDTVHDMRTSCRRIEASIDFLEGFSKRESSKKAKKKVNKILKKSNKSRDYQVHIDFLLKIEGQNNEIIDYFEKKYSKEKEKVKSYLKSLKISKLDHLLESCLSFLVFDFIQNFQINKPYFANLYTKEFEEVYEEFKNTDKSDDKKLHKIRIKVKDLRYKIEILGELKGKTLPEEDMFKQIQDILGTHHDLIVLKKKLVKKIQGDNVIALLKEMDKELTQIQGKINVDVNEIFEKLCNNISSQEA
ncbi:CHAD domain-containing protein [Petrotoga mobilis]|nr:CHAD domain-containing protein [Petrotoga mobilis]